jgi:hypothetical protein
LRGSTPGVIEELGALAAGRPDDSPAWREIADSSRHAAAGRLRYDCFRCRGVPLGSGAVAGTVRRLINPRLKGTSTSWEEANAEAVIRQQAAVLSGRWDQVLDRTRAATARDRRADWRWEPLACLAELKALDDQDVGSPQRSTKKHSKRTAA